MLKPPVLLSAWGLEYFGCRRWAWFLLAFKYVLRLHGIALGALHRTNDKQRLAPARTHLAEVAAQFLREILLIDDTDTITNLGYSAAWVAESNPTDQTATPAPSRTSRRLLSTAAATRRYERHYERAQHRAAAALLPTSAAADLDRSLTKHATQNSRNEGLLQIDAN